MRSAKIHAEVAMLALLVKLCIIAVGGEVLEDLKLSAKEVEQPLKVMLQSEESKTRLGVDLNYGCGLPACADNVTVANITIPHDPSQDNNADDPRDHHWTWSVIGRPTIQTALTSVRDDLTVNWSRLFMRRDISYSMTFSSRPDYSSALMLATLIEHDLGNNRTGEDDDARHVNSTRAYPVVHFSWRRNVLENTTSRVAFQFIGENFTAPEQQTFGDFGIPVGNITAGKINLTVRTSLDKIKILHGF